MVLRELMDDVARQFITSNRIFLKLTFYKKTHAIIGVSRPYKIENCKCDKDRIFMFIGSNGVLVVSDEYTILSESVPSLFLELVLHSRTNKKGVVARRERNKLRKYLMELEIPSNIRKDLVLLSGER